MTKTGTSLATVWAGQDLPTVTPEVTKSLSPQEVEGHRAKIAFEVRTVLSVYFQPHEDDAVRAGQLAWWCDELEDWEQEQVVWSLRKWNRDKPRIRPTPGDILAILNKQRGQAEVKRAAARAESIPQPDPTSEITPEDKARRAELVAEVMAKYHSEGE